MRCIACDCLLTDFEATRKSDATKEYLDLCNRCVMASDISGELSERYDLEGVNEHYKEEVSGIEPDTDGR